MSDWREVTQADFTAATEGCIRHPVTFTDPASVHYVDLQGRCVGREWLYENFPRDGTWPYVWRPNEYELATETKR